MTLLLRNISAKIQPKLLWLLLPITLLAACNNKDCRPDVDTAGIAVNFKLVRLEQEIEACKTTADVKNLLARHPQLAQVYLQVNEFGADTVSAELLHLAQSPYIDTTLQDVNHTFKSTRGLEQELKDMYARIKFYYPATPVPTWYTMVTGFGTDVFVSDSVGVIGLDYFLGSGAHYTVPNMPNYMSKRLRPDAIAPGVALVLADHFNQASLLDNTLLSEMVKWGKMYYFIENVLPCVPDSTIIGYSTGEIKSCKQNETQIFKHFVDKKLFYNTDHFIITKYTGERPYTLEIGDKAPGRLARWVGWQIVRKYAKETGSNLKAVMQETDAQKIFTHSKYKP